MIVALGFPSSSKMMMRGDIDSTFKRLSLAFDDNWKPTPPTDESLEFLVADEVTSWCEPIE